MLVDAAEDAAEQAQHALQRGARNILLAPPSYFKNVGEDGLFGWFSAVFAALGPLARDVLLYNIPSVTMVQLSLGLIGRLRTAFPDVVAGVKDSGGNWSYSEALLAAHGDLVILIGDERHLARAVRWVLKAQSRAWPISSPAKSAPWPRTDATIPASKVLCSNCSNIRSRRR